MSIEEILIQDSGDVEYYTPVDIATASKWVLNEIDLDPASSEIANQVIKAKQIYTKDDNGLIQPWAGRVFMNHPFGAKRNKCKDDCCKVTCLKRGWHYLENFPGNAAWINRLVDGYQNGDITAAICVTWNNTSNDWFRPLLDYPRCIPFKRTYYRKPDGTIQKESLKGSVITYLGNDIDRFNLHFSHIGKVNVPYDLVTKRLQHDN